MGIIDSLIKTESGGNSSAYRRNKDGREFFGLGQFGKARLSELGLGTDFTLDQFRASDSLQRAIFQRHIADIDKYIDAKGFDKYLGQTMQGVPITRDAMYAMAHLGGKGGLGKFLASGGSHNPSDELGTSLLDYAKTHGNAGGFAKMAEDQKSDPLKDFSADMRSAAQVAAAGTLTFGDHIKRTEPEFTRPSNAPQLGFGEAVSPLAVPKFTPQMGVPNLPPTMNPHTPSIDHQAIPFSPTNTYKIPTPSNAVADRFAAQSQGVAPPATSRTTG